MPYSARQAEMHSPASCCLAHLPVGKGDNSIACTLITCQQHCLMMLAYSQEGAGAEPAAKRRRVDTPTAVVSSSQLPTQPMPAPPQAAKQQLPGAEERRMLLEELLALAKQTGPAGEQKHQYSITQNISAAPQTHHRSPPWLPPFIQELLSPMILSRYDILRHTVQACLGQSLMRKSCHINNLLLFCIMCEEL